MIRDEVESRLRQCGFQLASSAFSEHYGVRLAVESASEGLDTPTNLGLNANACALLTILWAKLALQKRTASQTQATPNEQGDLIAAERRDRVREYQPSVRYETLAREFGSKLGGRTRLRALLGQLRKLKFVAYRRLDEIQAGPLLELAIDGEKMIGFIRSRVLARYLESSIDLPDRARIFRWTPRPNPRGAGAIDGASIDCPPRNTDRPRPARFKADRQTAARR